MTTQTDVVDSQTEPEKAPKSGTTPSLYRTVWRWHFYAGIFVMPVLIVMAVTGGLYVFRQELEQLFLADIVLADRQEQQVSLQTQVEAASAATPGMKPRTVIVYDDPDKATEVHFFNRDRNLRVFVNPYTGDYQGTIDRKNGFFGVVLTIHRSLFAGSYGRVATELTTSWTIILLMTGVFLWWPRKSRKPGGVWWPRLGSKPYTVLRDLHAVPAAYLAVLALLIAVTGLFFSLVWGRTFVQVASATGQIPSAVVGRPESGPATSGAPITIDKVFAMAREHYPGSHLALLLPRKPDDSFGAFVLGDHVTIRGAMVVDQYSGEVKDNVSWEQFPPMFQARTFAYPVHVGSIFGLPTKILAVATCLVLVCLPITGVWMWLRRRPKGKTGFPRSTRAMVVPPWLTVVIVGVCIFLPLAGLSLVAVLLIDWIVGRFRMVRNQPATYEGSL